MRKDGLACLCHSAEFPFPLSRIMCPVDAVYSYTGLQWAWPRNSARLRNNAFDA